MGRRLVRRESRTLTLRLLGTVALGCTCVVAAQQPDTARAPDGPASGDDAARLRGMRVEIGRLRDELAELSGRERSILGELERLGAELRLRRAEHREVSLRLETVHRALEHSTEQLARLEQAQQERRGYLAFRLREMYKAGPERELRKLVGGETVESYWSGLRYAAYLNERDARVLRAYRADAVAVTEERERLLAAQSELDRVSQELVQAQSRLQRSSHQRTRRLEEVREDKTKRETAIVELEQAADQLAELVRSLEPGEAAPTLDIRKFEGLLDWPAAGRVTAGFGRVVHPRFKTSVPHPGLDIEGDAGDWFGSVFDGQVVFAGWMRGYGLTAIVDHGGGLLSIYAHASVLLVEPGESVIRGQRLGAIGDTGSLRGAYLYFELRIDGRPTDPARWLRPR
jgi:septal ring factor EnvC (AmiA/AmiB activator)